MKFWVGIVLLTVLGLSSCKAQQDAAVPMPITEPVVRETPLPPRPVISQDEKEVCYHKACFKPVEVIDDRVFYLQGISTRKHLWFDVYTAGFYLTNGKSSLNHGVPDGEKLLILHYHRHIPKQKIVESIQTAVNENPHVDQKAVQERFDRLTEAFKEPKDGSRYYFVYLPERGTQLIHQGQTAVTLPGEDFAFAFFAIWLRDDSGDDGMRRELLAL